MLIFSKGSSESVDVVLRTLDTFAGISELKINPAKSQIFSCVVDHNMRDQILASTGFSSGTLLVCYLGNPLVSSRLTKIDRAVLVNRIAACINHWSAHLLSYAGASTTGKFRSLWHANLLVFHVHSTYWYL